MVLVKNLKFRQWFFLGSFLLKKVFGDVLYRKLAIFDRKNIDIKKTQNLYFSKGVCSWFKPKISDWFIFSF